jgi:alpha-ribazole phosphatase
MEIYLIRHTTPLIEKGICYGQSDLDVTETFLDEAAVIQNHLPANIETVYASPLQRCKKLAAHLFSSHSIQLQNELKEIHCGEWELMPWNDIAKEAIDPWMNDFVNVVIPGGESYTQLYHRVVTCFEGVKNSSLPAAIITHGGVIRSILAHVTNTPLSESFNVFQLNYGCVVKLFYTDGKLSHTILSNIVSEKETHKPAQY